MSATGKVRVVQTLINGGAVMSIPGSMLEVLWVGPGAERMFIGHPRKSGGVIFPIEHESCIGDFRSAREAVAAVQRFVDLSDSAESE